MEKMRVIQFQIGHTYKDSVGRKWIVKEIHWDGKYTMLVRRKWHPFGYAMAFVYEPEETVCDCDTAIIFTSPNEFGWTTLYAEG